jgi:hypothetical protein
VIGGHEVIANEQRERESGAGEVRPLSPTKRRPHPHCDTLGIDQNGTLAEGQSVRTCEIDLRTEGGIDALVERFPPAAQAIAPLERRV